MNTVVKKKHPQAIIAVDNSYFDLHNRDNSTRLPSDFKQGLTSFSIQTFLDEVQSHIVIRERAQLETEPQYRQLIPYMTITQLGTDGIVRYIPYQRTSTAGEQRLHGKVSVGFGGHIDLTDVCYSDDSVIDLGKTLLFAASREFGEEVRAVTNVDGVDTDVTNNYSAAFTDEIILLDLTPVDSVHVGIVMAIQVDANVTVTSLEDELELLSPMTASDLLAQNDDGTPKYDLENWTRIILENDVRVAAQLAAQNQATTTDVTIDTTTTTTVAVDLTDSTPAVVLVTDTTTESVSDDKAETSAVNDDSTSAVA